MYSVSEQVKILWEKLTNIYDSHRFDDVLEKFQSVEEHAEKIKYALNLLEKNDLFPKVPLRYPKNDDQSTEFRKSGNKCFEDKRYFDALEFYNKSICYAEPGTENLSIGYANRSAVYMKWQLFDKCLENIRLAKKANYPARLLPKLEKRSVECQEFKKTKQTLTPEIHVPKLSYSAHAQIPFMADSIELVENEKFGRHLIANRDLKVGDTVLLEKPFESRLHDLHKYRRCTNCLAENELTLIPCPDCTSAMFCSTQCMSSAHKKFHKYECPIIEALPVLQAGNSLMATRILLTLIEEYNGIQNLFTIVEEMCENGSPTTLLKLCSEPGRQGKHSFLHLLKNNMEIQKNIQTFQITLMLAVVYNFFTENTELKVLLDNANYENRFLNLLYQYTFICMSNSSELDVFERGSHGDEGILHFFSVFKSTYFNYFLNPAIMPAKYGNAIFCLSSLINHSCFPNLITTFNQSSNAALIVTFPIKKGTQLFVNYG
jgi:SET and MYND domain-containing protein 4